MSQRRPTRAQDVPDGELVPDELDIELFRHACSSILDEIELNLTRTAYSPLIYDYKDYVVGLLDNSFALLSQSELSLPAFVADLGPVVADAVGVVRAENLAPGDVLVSNYAAAQGHHLNNVVMIAPIFQEDRVIAYVAIRGHWADVGGLEPGSMSWNARDIHQEGTQYRGLRIMRAGEIVHENVATCLANTRFEEYVRGDLMAQLGGCQLGLSRWQERITSRWTCEEVEAFTSAQMGQSATLARSRVAALPDGAFTATCRTDDAGVPGTDPLQFTVRVEIDGDRMIIDLTAVPDQVEAPINSNAAVGDARVAYKSVIAPDHPTDEGLFAPLEVRTRPGSILTASKGAAMGHWNSTMPTVVDLVLQAFGTCSSDLAPAGHHASIGGFIFSGRRPDGSWWQSVDTAGGGWGASSRADGFSPLRTLSHGDNRSISVEVLEGSFPLTVEHVRYRPDTGGRGRYRGGCGVERLITTNEDAYLTTSVERTLDPPWGVAGGEPGVPGGVDVCVPGADTWVAYNKASSVALPAGSRVRIRSAGGGGWGPPADRDPAAHAADLRDGFVTKL
ncbi:hydantoinase B/oxoprolinase family protein [Amycolatopsis pithecellobii]|uniref:hydantoinase B/oxoprolinase family protein n=1 Tax=Amycolatopsis pithecellobii TaxID=664692 RepID=UPI0012B6F665|nr:hydantoinase B/oxoprolinase family protein [Amycolatopsis pithecellobii]